jgi:toxin YoeB
MKYEVNFSDKSQEDIELFKQAGDKRLLKKIDKLVDELYEHPRTGTGHPEQLKGYPDVERWSRRITGKHRLVYDIEEEIVVVLIISAFGHYDDK